MPGSLPNTLKAGFAAVIVTLLLNSLIPRYFIDKLIEANGDVKHTLTAVDALSELRIALTDAETGQRGYLLTHDLIYLAPYQRAIDKARIAQQRVHEQLDADPLQRQRLRRLDALAGQRLAVLKQTIELTRTGHAEEAMALVRSGIGNNWMESMRELLDQIDEAEDVRYAAEVDKANEAAQAAVLTFVLTSLLDAGLFIAVFLYMRRLFRDRGEVERKASRQSTILRAVLDSMHDGVVVADQDGKTMVFNPAAERLLGQRMTAVLEDIPRLPYQLKRADGSRYDNDQVPLARSLRGEVVVAEPMELAPPKGESTWLSVNSSPVLDQDGSRFGAVAVFSNITERMQGEVKMLALNQQLAKGMAELSNRNSEISQLGELTSILQSCRSELEACQVLSVYALRLFEGVAGALYLLVPSKNYLELAAQWGRPEQLPGVMSPDECWALRRSKPHRVLDSGEELCCEHIDHHESRPPAYLCLPMAAQGETIGLLYLKFTPERLERSIAGLEAFAATVAEHCGLAVSNLRLREQLRYQSMHDPLTGLFNRRFLEASLDIELNRVARTGETLTLAMIDIDYFKRFNDTFGHDAGDALLREFGALLRAESRSSDVACRYGGEEFLLILPGTGPDYARECLERLQEAVRRMEVSHAGKLLGSVTVSVGLACYPDHGDKAQMLLQRADAALYQAKNLGRDRIVVG